jgi:hypothetical protein
MKKFKILPGPSEGELIFEYKEECFLIKNIEVTDNGIVFDYDRISSVKKLTNFQKKKMLRRSFNSILVRSVKYAKEVILEKEAKDTV